LTRRPVACARPTAGTEARWSTDSVAASLMRVLVSPTRSSMPACAECVAIRPASVSCPTCSHQAAASVHTGLQPLADVCRDVQAVVETHNMLHNFSNRFGTWQELYDASCQITVANVGAPPIHQRPQSLPMHKASRLDA